MMKPSPEPIPSIQVDYRQEMSRLAKVGRLFEHPLIWPILAVVMLMALLFLGFYTWKVHHDQRIALAQVDILQANVAGLQSQVEELQVLNSGLHQQLIERENQIALFANAMRVIALEGTEDAPAARGTFYTGDASSLLVLRGLPPLPQSETYKLWLIPSDGEPIPAGLVRVEKSGATTVSIDMIDKAQDFAAVGVSIEPAGGSPQPTGPIVLLGIVQIADSR
jgi:hypothetical protein